MKGQYRVWCLTEGQSEDDCDLVQAYDHEEAATMYASNSFDSEPYSSAIDVMVRSTFGGDNGELKRFTVHPEPTVEFYAYEYEA